MIFSKAAVAGLTGVVGLVLGLTMGVTGANAVSHHNQDKGMTHSVTQGQNQNHTRQKDSNGSQSGQQQHKRFAAKGDNGQPKPDGTTQQNGAPNTDSAPTTK